MVMVVLGRRLRSSSSSCSLGRLLFLRVDLDDVCVSKLCGDDDGARRFLMRIFIAAFARHLAGELGLLAAPPPRDVRAELADKWEKYL